MIAGGGVFPMFVKSQLHNSRIDVVEIEPILLDISHDC